MTISSFTINPANGALTLVAGSPFATGLTFDSCQGMSVAATPDGNFLMASSNGQIMTFGITATGALTAAPLFTTATCCTPLDSMKISVNGQFLALADSNGVSMFTINADGSLTVVTGSPFPKTGSGSLAGLDFNSCSASHLYGGEAIGTTPTITDAWSVSGTGALSALVGSPYHTTGANSNVVLLSPDNRWLFESNQTSARVNTFSVAADGTLTSVGKFGGTGTVHVPAGMATDRSGTFLYVADDGVGLALFRINADGSLTSIKDQTVSTPAEIQSVAAYPPRSCANADVSVTMTASPNPVSIGSNVTYTVTVSNAGPDTAAVTLQDNFSTSLGSVTCSVSPSTAGTCVGTLSNRNVSIPALASGASVTVTFVAQVRTTVTSNTTIKNTVSVSNSSALDPDLSNNSATASVTAVNTALTALTVIPASGAFGGTVNLSA